MIHYISMTCVTEVNHPNRSFNIEFAVGNIKYNILGTPFFKENFQNIDFQQNIMTYIEQHTKLLTKTPFSTCTEKDYPFISFILLNVKNQFTSNQDQERLYTSQVNTILTCILNLKIKLNFIHQFHIHIFLQKYKDIFHF